MANQTVGEAHEQPQTPKGPPASDGQSGQPVDQRLDRALRTLNEALHGGGARDFSDEALALVLKLQLDYVEEVGSEAIRLANRNRCDVVSANDFEQADQTVRGSPNGRAWFEALGGIFAGAGIGTFLQIAVDTNPSVVGLSISGIVALGGFTTVAAALARRGIRS